MKTSSNFSPIGLVLLLFVLSLATATGQIQVLLSVKFIHNADGASPGGILATPGGFDSEVARGNGILGETWRGYQLVVVEYLDIQPSAPPGQASDYWFNLDAREKNDTIEFAASLDFITWGWNPNAINIYVNNSCCSGQCSLVGQGGAITLGRSVGIGTVLHEVGHIFDLKHTHSGDPDCGTFTPTQPLILNLADGDGLSPTMNDHACFTRDQLSMAVFFRAYDALSDAEKEVVNSSWLNVMSYHQEDRLLDAQMDIWAVNANLFRRGFCSGRTWFVDPRGICAIRLGGVKCNGLDGGPYNTVAEGVNSASSSGGDIVMLRPSSYNERLTINKPVTLRVTHEGPATIGR